jgi:hypothetical protein
VRRRVKMVAVMKKRVTIVVTIVVRVVVRVVVRIVVRVVVRMMPLSPYA